MKNSRRKIFRIMTMCLMIVMMMSVTVFAEGEATEYVPKLYSTVWALVPPVVAITLALITKEVYSSLFVGIAVGGIFYGGGNFERTITHVLNDGLIGVLSDPYNVGILIFLVILGAMVSLMNRAGGSAAFGRWASQHIKTRVGAQITTIILGCLIFIDDYFNCLTVGSVMRPITDKHNVSRAKLAYLIDSTAAPICIIAPISSWAAAVTGFVPGEDGLSVFVQAIPFNFYALFTIIMMLGLVLLKVDYGPMKLHEDNAKKGDLFTTGARPYAYNEEVKENTKGHVLDLLIPIASLIVFCVIGMIYTGGFFSGESIVTAFSNADASVGLALGSFFALVVTIVLYVCRKALTFKECMDCIPEGFKSMVPAIMILTFAWSLKAMTDSLGAAPFVEGIMKGNAQALMNFLPAVIFLVGCFLAFATGTSWGTFGILIPIVVGVFANDHQMMIIAISACMAGAVCGDHCSPISDTTIMASAGSQSDHVNHVSTQIPYAATVAVISCITYIIAGFTKSAAISLGFGLIAVLGTLAFIKSREKANGTYVE
ncbi:Na+/H+ antiporter NhaC family protein [Peptacetobacter hiranonis]|uniref:Na+/H+ antiporter family protein n=1 Tax=Peptacetobacter hiranonis (strain DSM 13275 / JCM 10541 / KCTC 15199 / TO-931) TaxID=500633 RepID=B6FZN5_PEPHT|nr:Na+/H+ antiporter NhaC family protein [Peptacetobacter hiranonis]EEA84979.1 Na+/H+ antiporter family protein [Peptacetobacter hiranonis DSM 13275]QEK20880.1 Malate-2H(+)/Na(+)-lactate antiporter [Peptacetobacter hiranonis]